MNSTTTAYDAALRPLSTVLDAVPADAWDAPSPCAGWSARQVVAHLVDTQRDLLARHGHGDALGPAPDLTDPAAGLREHAGRVLALVSRDEVADAACDTPFGPTTVGGVLVRFYVWDLLVHRWDVARATGGEEALTPDELDRVEAGADGFGEALHADGVCAPPVPVPAEADRQTRVLARLGRRARPTT